MAPSGEINGFTHLPGKNCLTTAIRNILNFYGFRFQESMVFGLAEGLGFQFETVPGLDSPYLGGTGKQLLQNFCANLDLKYELMAWETDQEALDDLREQIDRQIPVIVHVDLYYLPYFKSEMHFAGHRVIPIGYDENLIYLADTGFNKIQECPVDDFARARASAYTPFNPHRRRVSLERPAQKPFIEEHVAKALYNLLSKFKYNAPGYNLGRIQMLKEHLGDYKSPRRLYVQIEKAGTGGGLSRNLFADFLDQAFQIYSRGIYGEASVLYEDSAQLWRQIAVGARNGDLSEAPSLLDEIYEMEQEALHVLTRFEADDL
jgi:hypothetical protein